MATNNVPSKPRRAWRAAAALLALTAVAAATVAWLAGLGPHTQDGSDTAAAQPPGAATGETAGTTADKTASDAAARGAYLALAGNCAACHTARGGAPWAGGLAIATPFGTVYSSNLTPDAQTGLGRWTADDFWRALHHGRSRDGRFLLPAFPYPQYTRVTRSDADALWAHLRSLPAVGQANRPHELRFPYDSQAAMAVWRALFFRPQVQQADPAHSAAWNRGAYLVEGLGHCATCHASRNLLGATQDAAALGGGPIPMQGWYAPSLASPAEAGVADWDTAAVVALLQTGRTPQGAVLGPMAEVVTRSTQHLHPDDLRAMADYLKSLPQQTRKPAAAEAPPAAVMARGLAVYKDRCADCHGAQGEGASPAYPALAGNRAVTLTVPTNLIRVVLGGGFAPDTAGQPRPYGMPPFGHELNDEDVAAVLTHIRHSWGNQAGAVAPQAVQGLR